MAGNDIYSILMGSEPEAADSARAMANAIRRNRNFAMGAGLGAADPLGAMGKSVADFGKQDEGLLENAARNRLHYTPQLDAMRTKKEMYARPEVQSILGKIGYEFAPDIAGKEFAGLPPPMQMDLMKELSDVRGKRDAAKFRLSVTQAGMPSPEVVKILADKAQSKGGLSSYDIPRGPSAGPTAMAIWQEVAKRNPNADLATAGAKYGANEKALKSVQETSDLMNAFEGTARANLNMVKEAAKPLVDSGSPALNRPWRSLQLSVNGSPEQAVFNAARQVASTEVARVLQSVRGSGILTNEAREEVDKILSGNFTIKQLLAAINLLERDMENRKVSYARQINEIQSRFKAEDISRAGEAGTPQQGGQTGGMSEQELMNLYTKKK